MDNYKKRLIEKFEESDTNNFSNDFLDESKLKKEKKKSSQEFISKEDLNDYRKKYDNIEKDDILRRIIHLETINIQSEKLIEKMKYKIKNLEMENQELKKMLDE